MTYQTTETGPASSHLTLTQIRKNDIDGLTPHSSRFDKGHQTSKTAYIPGAKEMTLGDFRPNLIQWVHHFFDNLFPSFHLHLFVPNLTGQLFVNEGRNTHGTVTDSVQVTLQSNIIHPKFRITLATVITFICFWTLKL